MDSLDFGIPSLLSYEPVPESPRLEAPEVGLRLLARQVAWDGEVLSLELLAGYLFEAGFARGFQRLSEAIVLGLEDAERGRAAATPILDPWKRYPRRAGPNFGGVRPPDPGAPTHHSGSVVIPLEIPLAPPALPGPSFYVTAFLQGHVSNTLAFDLAAGSVVGYLDGEPCEVPTEGSEEPPEELDEAAILGTEPESPVAAPLARPGTRALTLAARKQGSHAPGEPILLDATLALPPDELAVIGPEGWLRSLFAWASRQDSQGTRVGHWQGDRTVFADDFALRSVAGQPRAVATASFELSNLLGARIEPGVHYVQTSARHHRSNVLEIACV